MIIRYHWQVNTYNNFYKTTLQRLYKSIIHIIMYQMSAFTQILISHISNHAHLCDATHHINFL